MTQPTASSVSRVQRIIAYMIGAMVLVSVIAFVVILGAAYFGASGEFDRGVWPVVALVPLIALPLAVIGWVALLVVSMRRRALETAEQQRAALAPHPTRGATVRKGKDGIASGSTGTSARQQKSATAGSAEGKTARATGDEADRADPRARPKSGTRRPPRSS